MKVDNNPQYPALTNKGNPYNPCRVGLMSGAVIGGIFGHDAGVVASSVIKKLPTDEFKAQLQDKTNLQKAGAYLKRGAKTAGQFGIIAAGIALFASLGSLVGNLLDAPMNKERKDQADGEAAHKENVVIGQMLENVIDKNAKAMKEQAETKADFDKAQIESQEEIEEPSEENIDEAETSITPEEVEDEEETLTSKEVQEELLTDEETQDEEVQEATQASKELSIDEVVDEEEEETSQVPEEETKETQEEK